MNNLNVMNTPTPGILTGNMVEKEVKEVINSNIHGKEAKLVEPEEKPKKGTKKRRKKV